MSAASNPARLMRSAFPEQQGADGIRIPALTEVFDLVARAKADHIRFNIETKLTPTSGSDTPDPETFAAALAKSLRDAGLTSRATVQSFDWRTLVAMRAIAPEIERVCLTIEDAATTTCSAANPALALDRGLRYRRCRRLGAAAGRGGRMRGLVALFPQPDRRESRAIPFAWPEGDPLDGQRARRDGAPDRSRRRRHHHGLSRPAAGGLARQEHSPSACRDDQLTLIRAAKREINARLLEALPSLVCAISEGEPKWRKRPTTSISTAIRRISSR